MFIRTIIFIKYCDIRYRFREKLPQTKCIKLCAGESLMRGALILMAFFSVFLLASLLIPSPMFPGNFFCMLIGEAVSQYTEYLSALFNGVFYAVILWLVFVIISKSLTQEN